MIKKIYKKIFLFFTRNPYKIANYYKKVGVKMGENVQIYNDVNFGTEPYLIKLGDNVKITNKVSFITHDGGINVLRNLGKLEGNDFFGKILIGDNVFIGNGVYILPNVSIGDNCVIGAGSVVTKKFPSNVIIAGVPAKIINSLDQYHKKMKHFSVPTKKMSPKRKEEYLKHFEK